MNVAFLTHTVRQYGANRSLFDLITRLQKYGVRPFLIAPRECVLSEALSARGIPVSFIPMARCFKQTREEDTTERQYSNELAQEFEQREIERRIEQWDIDVIYSNSIMIDCGFRAAGSAGLPHIWHLREFGNLDYDRVPVGGWSRVRNLIAQSDASISVSRAVRGHLLGSSYNRYDHVIYNGIAYRSDYQQRRKARLHNLRSLRGRPYTFVLVGRLMNGKGQKKALEALAILSAHSDTVRLQIVGDGDTHSLVAYADSLGIGGYVEFHGYVENPIQLMLRADAALMCSQAEAFGRVTAEAMSTGLPVIGNNSGATSEIIQHDQNGLLYEGDCDSLAACMDTLASSPRTGWRLGEAGWLDAIERYSVERYVEQVWDVINVNTRPGTKKAPVQYLPVHDAKTFYSR